MKVKIIIDDKNPKDEITLTIAEMTDEVKRLIHELENNTLLAYHRGSEHTLNIHEIIFFEVEADSVYAHLPNSAYMTKYRLYELEDILPNTFVRISKSSIVNTRLIASIQRNLTSVREITFHECHKVVYVSRKYYPILKEKMEEKSL